MTRPAVSKQAVWQAERDALRWFAIAWLLDEWAARAAMEAA